VLTSYLSNATVLEVLCQYVEVANIGITEGTLPLPCTSTSCLETVAPRNPGAPLATCATPLLPRGAQRIISVTSLLALLSELYQAVTRAVLPHTGGPGPRLESWAFAIDEVGLRVVVAAGVFQTRTCKLCTDGIVVSGEYGLTAALFAHGLSINTLMAKYADTVNWLDGANWACNDQVRP
jgi:hypothetical protein